MRMVSSDVLKHAGIANSSKDVLKHAGVSGVIQPRYLSAVRLACRHGQQPHPPAPKKFLRKKDHIDYT